MLTGIFLVAALLFFIALERGERKGKGAEDSEMNFYVGCFICSAIGFMVCVLLKVAMLYCVYIAHPIVDERLIADRKVYEKRVTNFEQLVQTQLSKYPEYEKEIFASVDANMVMNFPDIKNDKITLAAFESMVEWREKVYTLEVERNQLTATDKVQRKIIVWF